MQINTISVYPKAVYYNQNQSNLPLKQKTNTRTLKLINNKDAKQYATPPNVYFHPSFCAVKRFGTERAFIYGAGGDLYNGHLGVKAAIERLFKIKNISGYDPNSQRLREYGYKVVDGEYDVSDSSIFCLSPSKYHAAQILDALKNGKAKGIKGVYVEKPMCTSPEQLKEIEKALKESEIPLYCGDHYFFSNMAGLRLMGVDMPYAERVKIAFDNSRNKKFTECINGAKAYFDPEDIKCVVTKMNEYGSDELLKRVWLQSKPKGGGILLDLQLHALDLLNIMGLKTTKITSVYGLKYPFVGEAIANEERHLSKSLRGIFRPIEAGEVEDRILMTGIINDKTMATFECSQFMPRGEKYITIEGHNGQKINLLISSGERKVQLLDENNEVLAEASTEGKPYDLMMEHAQSYFSKEGNDKLPSLFFDTQKTTLKQVFDVKDRLGI